MSDEQIIEIYNRMVDHFGAKLPCPEQQPMQFAYYVKLFRYYNRI